MTALPPDATRYLIRVRSLEPPIDLVDSIMAEVEATPQVRTGPDLRAFSSFVLAAAAVLLAIAVLLRLGTSNVGPAPTAVPLDQLPSAGQVADRISIERSDVPATFGHGFLWLTNAATGELIRMDPANGSIYSPLEVTAEGSEVSIALTETSVWVADQRDSTLVGLDPASLEERRRIPVEATVSALAADGPNLWALHREAGEVVRIDPTVGSTSLTLPIDRASALLLHAGSVWVGDDLGALIRFDPATGQETGRVDLGVVSARLVAVDDSVLVVGSAGDPVIRVDIGSLRILARGVAAMAIAAEDGQTWAVLASGHVARLDAETLQPVAVTALELDAAGTLATGAGALWTTGVDAAGDAYLIQVVPEP